jgi:hypothetical protein
VDDLEEDAIRVSVNDAFHRGVAPVADGIFAFLGNADEFACIREVLARERITGDRLTDLCGDIGWNCHGVAARDAVDDLDVCGRQKA